MCCGLFKPSADEEGAEECAGHFDPVRKGCLDVEFRDGPLSARVRALVVDPLAVPFHLGQVFVEDLARSQRRHQVVELAAVVLSVGLRLPSLPLFLALLPQLTTETVFMVS